ncbi:MAG: hypothetical protein K9N46_05145 [Candidatus Marinimicrobia bacterium]|nr:hypothetical protein [Candidatus Neomarinimicrobiota bacterium]MCF7829494.1 hypothetical protein [Candidatus Neomarinimicrobiota bacterium]MCF7880108.1 hypothetical protein [Candidatus Neomarinimicrobiota bacterium]
MEKFDMLGPFELNEEGIDGNVPESPGVYALGYLDEDDSFVVCYVGRSDDILNEKLTGWVDAIARYTHFQYVTTESAQEAFIQECHNYHDYGGSDILYNSNHPYRTEKTDWVCPRCPFYGR